MHALLRHKTTYEVSTLLHKQRWSSTRQNIPFETFEVTIYATLGTRRKNGVKFSRGHHAYKNLVWSNAKHGDVVTVEVETGKESKKIYPYCCTLKAMVDILPRLKTVGHVPGEISRHIFFFLKEKKRKVDGFVYSTQYQSLQEV